MTIGDILEPAAVLAALEAETPDAAIRALARRVRLPDGGHDELELSALARERAGSTGIGGGIALPHGCCAGIEQPALALARLAEPIDFRAPDGLPVRLVFLLAVPKERYDSHLYPLSALSQLDGRAERLSAAQNAEELRRVVADVPL